ncbi:MAG TPA: DegT/DnrJ/EryC1/StrS aminotransferase family protein [Flavobacteriaceae bacterium]|nr:DegT/DnrJ/EryC1/StrS aminotransferase family protein [Flavobacteriaceae bacterium]
MKIPFSPPDINDSVLDEVKDSLISGWITTGPKVKKLEGLVSKYTPSPKTLCVNSATSGLMLALKWYHVGPGDEVIIPAYTYAATALAVIHVGAVPVMVDVENDFNISISKIEKSITEKTKAIIPVDIAGWPCDYDEINDLVKQKQNLFVPKGQNQEKLKRILVVSDSAHSIGAKYKKNYIGAVSDITVFSFHAVKNVTTAEGGALCINLPKPFNNQEVYDYLRLYTLNGQTKDAFTKSKAGGWKYDIAFAGLKINLPDVLAAIGVAQLPNYFESTLQRRKLIFDFYQTFLSKCKWAILPPLESQDKVSSCHIYALRINNINEETRDLIIEKITEKGVAVNVHFQPLPILTLFKKLGYNISDFPVAYNNYKCEISLPIYPQLTQEELNYIVNSVRESVESSIT